VGVPVRITEAPLWGPSTGYNHMLGKDARDWYAMLARSFAPADWFRDGDRPQGGDKEERLMWVYREAGGRWEVGFYDPEGEWHEDSWHRTRQEAAARVHYLNGGNVPLQGEGRE